MSMNMWMVVDSWWGITIYIRIVGIGFIKIRMFDGTTRTLYGARHAPRLKRNLICLGMLDGLGYFFKSDNGGLRIMKGTELVMKGVKNNGL